MSGGGGSVVEWSGRLVVAGAVSVAVLNAPAIGAVADGTVEAAAITHAQPLAGTADLTLRYDQEDGPDSGHIRVTLTPELRALSLIEARAAAQQAFLNALDDPALGDPIRRVRVVVRLMPATHPDPGNAQKMIVYEHKGGREWTVKSGE